MSKPDNVPQDIWDGVHYVLANSPEYSLTLHEAVARAIMAERERGESLNRKLGEALFVFADFASNFTLEDIRNHQDQVLMKAKVPILRVTHTITLGDFVRARRVMESSSE